MDWTLDLFFQRDIVLLKVFKGKGASEVRLDAPVTKLEAKSAQGL